MCLVKYERNHQLFKTIVLLYIRYKVMNVNNFELTIKNGYVFVICFCNHRDFTFYSKVQGNV